MAYRVDVPLGNTPADTPLKREFLDGVRAKLISLIMPFEPRKAVSIQEFATWCFGSGQELLTDETTEYLFDAGLLAAGREAGLVYVRPEVRRAVRELMYRDELLQYQLHHASL